MKALIESGGARGRNRTTETVIFSHVLYQLSYLGAEPALAAWAKGKAGGVIGAKRLRFAKNDASSSFMPP